MNNIKSKVLQYLSKKCALDRSHFSELCRKSEYTRIICNCYIDSEFSSKEENLKAFLSFVEAVQYILVVITILLCVNLGFKL